MNYFVKIKFKEFQISPKLRTLKIFLYTIQCEFQFGHYNSKILLIDLKEL